MSHVLVNLWKDPFEGYSVWAVRLDEGEDKDDDTNERRWFPVDVKHHEALRSVTDLLTPEDRWTGTHGKRYAFTWGEWDAIIGGGDGRVEGYERSRKD